MPANPYNPGYINTIQDERSDVQNDFASARSELSAQSAPPTTYIDIAWDGSNIISIWDNLDLVSGANDTQRFKYYDHLRGLFRKAMENLYYP